MKKKMLSKITAILAASFMAAIPVTSSAYAADAVITARKPANVKEVKDSGDNLVKGELSVHIPDDITGSYTVKAYEILRLVIPENSTWTFTGTDPAPMTNSDTSKNIYVVTDDFKDLFADIYTAYTADSTDGAALRAAAKLYLTYDDTNNKLAMSAAAPAGKTKNKDYIELDNAAASKIDRTFFEASVISKLTGSNAAPTETEASAVRLFSDWSSKYVIGKSIAENATAVWNDTNKNYEFKEGNKLVYGYHLVVTTDNSTDQNTAALNQNILNVPMAQSVTLKAKAITIDKSVSNLLDSNNRNNGATGANAATTKYDVDTPGTGTKYDKITSSIGDVNHYVVESHIPSYTSFDLDLAGTGGKLLPLATEITSTNLDTVTAGKYVYIFRDTMQYQDFIPVDITDTTKYGAAVNGIRVKIKAAGTETEKVYMIKDFGTTGSPRYQLVLNAASEETTSIGRLWETDYTTATHNNFFAINFDMKKLKELKLDGRDVEVSYNAELMGEATTDGAENEVKIRYSNDPFDAATFSNDTLNDKNEVYTYDLKLDKLFSDGSTTDFYDDVSFKLFTDAAKTHAVRFTGSNGNYVRVDNNDNPAQTVEILSVKNTDGTLLLHGLGEGTYYLVEQDDTDLNNAGYNILNPITVVIKANNSGTPVDTDNFKLFSGTATQSGATLDDVAVTVTGTSNGYGIEFEVVNQKGFRLPLTGESGNWFMAIGGIVLIAVGGTVIVLANRKKKETVSKK